MSHHCYQRLGWQCSVRGTTTASRNLFTLVSQCASCQQSTLATNGISEILRRFWEISKYDDTSHQSSEMLSSSNIMNQHRLHHGHSTRVPRGELMLNSQDQFYLLHQAVVNNPSSTTNVRLLFEAPNQPGNSLNNKLLIKLAITLMRWRRHRSHLVSTSTRGIDNPRSTQRIMPGSV